MLLTAYADTDVAIRAINDIGLDYYLLKPWDPPEERLYPVIDDLLERLAGRARRRRRAGSASSGTAGRSGATRSRRSSRATTFPTCGSTSNATTKPSGCTTSRTRRPADLPLVLVPDGDTLRAPSTLEVAQRARPAHDAPSSRSTTSASSAAVRPVSRPPCTARPKGCRRVIVEREAPGGQAGQSAAIENYLGFPKGLSGADLTHRAVAQATRFGAEMVLRPRRRRARDARSGARGVLRRHARSRRAPCSSRPACRTACSKRRASAELAGRGVYYGATASEARLCQGDDVYVVGAANSAGQAVLNLARYARRVVLLVRSDALEKSMSQYLVERILATPNVEVRLQTEVARRERRRPPGGPHARRIERRARRKTCQTNWLFVFIGASPRTDWLGDDVARDDKGFVVTGHDLLDAARRPALAAAPVPRSRWRPACPECSRPATFASTR